MADSARQLTLVADERRYDLVVPLGTRVADVLAVLGISSTGGTGSVATPAGHVLGPQDRLDERLPPGSVLTVVRTTTHRVTRDVVVLDTSSAAPGSRPAGPGVPGGPAWAGGARTRSSPVARGAVAVDDSTRRRGALDPDTTVSRSSVLVEPVDHPAVRRRTRGPDPAVAVVAAGSAVALVASLVAPGGPAAPSDAGSDAARWVAAAVLATAAVLTTVVLPRTLRGARVARLAAAPALAAAAGATLPLPESPARVSVSLLLAAGAAVLVLALGTVDAAGAPRAERTAMACLGGGAAVLAAGVLAGWSPTASAALVLGLAPLAVRALPTATLDVDPAQLVDTERLSTTVWAVRQGPAGRRRRVVAHDVDDRVARARTSVSVGTAYLTSAAVVAGAVVALAPPQSDLAPWARWSLPFAAAVALGYSSRAVRDRVARFAMLAASASLTAAAALALLADHPGWRWAVVGLTLGTAGVVTVAALALDAGWRSPRLSRLADRLESLAVVAVLPLGLLAAGAVEGLRRMTSG